MREAVAACFNSFIVDPIASMLVTDTGVIIEMQEHPDVPEHEYLTLERIAKAIIAAYTMYVQKPQKIAYELLLRETEDISMRLEPAITSEQPLETTGLGVIRLGS
jgi:hypothetical protein